MKCSNTTNAKYILNGNTHQTIKVQKTHLQVPILPTYTSRHGNCVCCFLYNMRLGKHTNINKYESQSIFYQRIMKLNDLHQYFK